MPAVPRPFRAQAAANCLAWAPHSSCHICSAGDDSQVRLRLLSQFSHFPFSTMRSEGHSGRPAHCAVSTVRPQALIWDLSTMSQPMDNGLDPILAYSAGAEINQLQWSSTQPDWIAIAFANKLQILRV